MVDPFVQKTEKTIIQAETDIATVLQRPKLQPKLEEQVADVPQTILSSEIRGMDVSDSAVMPKENESKVSTNLKSQKDSISPRPEFSMGMEEYDKLQEIYKKLVRQENDVLVCEKELGQLRQELLLCTGVFQGKCRKELQGQITDKEQQMANTKQRLGDIVRGYGYPSVDLFMRVYRSTKADYADYTKRLKEWGETYGMRYGKDTLKKGKNLLCSITLLCKKDKIALKSFLNACIRCVKIFIRKSLSTGW